MRNGTVLVVAMMVVAGSAAAQVAPPAAPSKPATTSGTPGPLAPPAAPSGTTPTLAPPVPVPSWQAVGSDIPADPAWRTGTLANGVRFAVRRNALPAGSLSIRVRMDAGGLMGDDSQAGWAHLVEHMTFRGTAHYGDGEGSKVWQRLGANFGSDSNAFTSPRATTYVLDLPRSDEASYREAMRVIAEMMQSAKIDPAALAIERNVVLAERSQRMTPFQLKLDAANRATMLAGTKLGRYSIVGTPETLAAADATSLRAWYKRWYRPERAVVVVVGDADPALLEQVVRDTFGGWQGEGPKPAEPDYGSPRPPARPAAVVADPQAPNRDEVAWIAPHDDSAWTIARQQRQYLEWVAIALLNQRLSTATQAGGALVNASAGRSTQRHIADQLSISFVSRPGQTRAALDQLFAVLNDLRNDTPDKAEVDQHVINVQGGLRRLIDEVASARSAGLANLFINDTDGGTVTGTRPFFLSLFLAQKPAITPEAIHHTLAGLLASDPRLIHLTSTNADPAAIAADLAAARQVAAGHQAAVRAVSMREIASPGPAGTVASRSSIADLGIERVRFANGVTLDYKRTSFEKDTIRLRVLVGHGLLGHPVSDPGLFWTAGALGAAGVGPFTRDELTKLTNGRRIGFSIGASTAGIQISGVPGRADLADALRLMVVAMNQMRYAESPIARLRDDSRATYQTLYGQPGSVLGAFGTPNLYGGDTRFRGIPPQREIEGVTLAEFQRFWTAELAKGPIHIEAVGDLDGAALVDAVAKSFGALPPRTDVPPPPVQIDVVAAKPKTPITVLRHRGDPDQAVVARVYPTPGIFPDLQLTRTLGLAAAIIEQRLTEEFREQDGGTYSPSVSRGGSSHLPLYGNMIALAQLRVGRIAGFQAAIDRITADLAANGPTADQLARAKAIQIASIERARGSDNNYWLSIIDNGLDDPRELDSMRTAVSGRQAITADQVKAAAGRWLTPANSFTIEVLPQSAVPVDTRRR